MKNFKLDQFTCEIICDGETKDAKATFEQKGRTLTVSLTAEEDRPQYVKLNWDFETKEELYVLGDAWERSYGELSFRKLSDNDRPMPWYFAATDQAQTWCFGVKTQPNAFVCFQYIMDGITALIDCRNGGAGVRLQGRKVELCTFVFRQENKPPFEALQDFCRELCEKPLLPDAPIYGGNNWYYAYGKSSYEEIVSDTRLQAEMAEGIPNRPFMVIDDGWQLKHAAGYNGGPWHSGNARFPDMRRLACEIRERKLHPGIWYRPLVTDESVPEEWRLMRSQEKRFTVLDPSHPAVLEKVEHMTRTLADWGYELLKHDFTTCDIFGRFGPSMNQTLTDDGWHFYDRSKTSAEIITGLYRAIRSGAEGDTVVLGCNTVSHLAAGLFELQRTGDDTSGREWERTRKMGVNTLAFRMPQHNAFYCCDADCAGVTAFIDWKLNKEWLRLLAVSGTPLFVSADPDTVTPEQKREMKAAFRTALEVAAPAEPINWQDTTCPDRWLTAKGEMNFRLPSAEA